MMQFNLSVCRWFAVVQRYKNNRNQQPAELIVNFRHPDFVPLILLSMCDMEACFIPYGVKKKVIVTFYLTILTFFLQFNLEFTSRSLTLHLVIMNLFS